MKESNTKGCPDATPAIGSRQNRKSTKALGACTETETIERALENCDWRRRKESPCLGPTEKLVKSGIEIKDVFDHLNSK